ncbi:hypothetical protein [Thermomonas sp.]|uniref:hypothetical protein n=1 Tax=Thermomonas sp. TaxID=1971895 RepID=UPI00248A2BA2|nr:hypothetical protein [Thermomonas sp.]MDI1253633.1 hypothetical protein [Thermomonas sp.]
MTAWPCLRRAGPVLLPVVILGLTLFEIRRQAVAMDWTALRMAFSRIGAVSLWECVLATAGSFMGLALIEAWAVRRQPSLEVSTVTAMYTGAASHALGHVLGWHAVLGTLVRRKAYHADRPQLLRILFAVGAAVFAGAASSLAIGAAALHSPLSAWLMVGGVMAFAVFGRRRGGGATQAPGSRRRIVPRLQHAASIFPIALLEAAAGMTALWVLLPAGTFSSWPAFVVTCVLAQAIGVASHAPGGLGVFEAAMLASVPAEARPGLLAAILAYRALYGLLPFATLGVPWLLWRWLHRRPAAAACQAAQLDAG